jgi:hemerythrin-like domain-containing protein
MQYRQPGLALRVQRGARTISIQHRQLDDFYLRVATALDEGELDTARAAFARFSDALEAHFALEEGLYFPALHGLRPGLGRDLERLCDEHQQLRETLARLARSIERGGCESCASLLHRFAGDLAEHERREEDLLASFQKGGEER